MRFARSEPLPRFLPLAAVELGRPAKSHSAGYGPDPSLFLSKANADGTGNTED